MSILKNIVSRNTIVGFALFLMVGTASADLLGVSPGQPNILIFPSGNLPNMSYDAGTDTLTLEGRPIRVSFSDGSRQRVNNGILTIIVDIDAAGTATGGTLLLTGTATNGTTYASPLLQGTFVEYGSADSAALNGDSFDFRFAPTGGSLVTLYGDDDIGVAVNLEGSSFNGSFSTSWTASKIKGSVGPIPPLEVCTGTIGDFVWVDENRNGQQDIGEPGIGGVTVNITDGAGFNDSTTTAGDGSYSFTGLDCGVTYTVSVINPDSSTYQRAQVNVGDDTTDSDNHDGATATPTATNPTDNTVDFGYELIPASLGDFVWLDENQNGAQDNGEPGLAGVTVVLKECQGGVIGDMITQTTTSGNPLGFYEFTNLNPGDYAVMVMAPDASYTFTVKDNAADALDSDVNPATGNTDCITLAPGENNPDVDAGLYQGAGLGNYVWEDLNANGIQDDGNTGISGVQVDLLDCAMNPTGDTTFTDNDGLYSFNDLAAGCYIVMFNTPVGFDSASPTGQGNFATDSDANPVTGKTGQIQLADGQFDPDWDAGFYKTATLGDRVWHDVNRNGLQDQGEPGLNVCTVTLQDSQGGFVADTTTSGDGDYLFTGLEPGEYMVQFDDSCTDNWVYTLQDVDDPASDAIDSDANTMGKTGSYILVSGDNILTVDAGLHEPAEPKISIEKATSALASDPNADDADSPTGPFIPFEDAVYWTYVVTNIGNRDLTNVVVTDDNGTPLVATDDFVVVCDKTALIVNESTNCQASNPNPDFKGQYNNVGTVTADDPDNEPVTDQDPSHYFGADPSIDIVKTTRLASEDVNAGGDGIEIAAGSDIAWDYLITNDGNVKLINVELTDDELLLLDPITCPSGMLSANGGSMTCTVSGFQAIAGDYDNVGTVVGTPADDNNTALGLPDVSDFDPSSYFGTTAPAISLVKVTSDGVQTDGDGLNIAAGTAITWKYTVTNTGDVALENLNLFDNQEGTISCPQATLAVGESITCMQSGTAQAGDYSNSAEVCANDATGATPDAVCADDPSSYFGTTAPAISLVKVTSDGVQADGDGLNIAQGTAITWKYTVTNTGDVALENLNLFDNQEGTISCPQATLAVGESITCMQSGTAQAGDYSNSAEVCANDATGATPDAVCADDPSSYFGTTAPAISLVKVTSDGVQADGDGLNIAQGTAITWKYTVTNTGDVALENLNLFDNQEGTISCPQATLAVGESITCMQSGTAQAGDYSNSAEVCANDATGATPDAVCADDPSSYFGTTAPAISLVKVTSDGVQADGDGLNIAQGTAITWKYTVTNTGDVALENLNLFDNQEGTISCPQATLAVGESITCMQSGTAQAGDYSNSAEVCANDATGATPDAVCADDPSSYFGTTAPAISLVKVTSDGVQADGDGLNIAQGTAITWKYTVTNTGDVALENLNLFDNQEGTISCPQATLAVGESITCMQSGTAQAGDYSNSAEVCANDATGATPDAVCADDPSSYFGTTAPAISLVKVTSDGVQADGDGLNIAQGTAITWKYTVTNTGDVALENLNLFDNQEGTISCPQATLAVGESITCMQSGTAQAGDYSNSAEVCANDATGATPDAVCADDPSSYFGTTAPAISLVKVTSDGVQADGDGLNIAQGTAITWKYTVTNTGDVALENLNLIDNQEGGITCPQATLAVDESITCMQTGTAQAGDYTNAAVVCASDATGATPGEVCANDPSSYFGTTAPAISLVKVTLDGTNEGDGLIVAEGADIAWKYTVKNIGDVALKNLILIDDQEGTISCPQTTLAVGEEIECVRSGTAQAGDYTNAAEVCANDATGATPDAVCADDPSSYFGEVACNLTLDKMCFVPPPPPSSNFSCDKPIDSLTMIWTGQNGVTVKAWKGEVGSILLDEVSGVNAGDEVTVDGYAGSPNDVYWEIFDSNGNKIGESNFHLSCSDDEMDGPEDCGLPQGNGKDNDSSLLNLWKLEGMIDASNTLDCTVDDTPTYLQACEFTPDSAPSCETTGNPDTLTWRYDGGTDGSCENSTFNVQGDFQDSCAGSVNVGETITVVDDNGDVYSVGLNDEFTMSLDSAKSISLSNGGGTQSFNLHTSCSQPIEAGLTAGALTLVALDGQRADREVEYAYMVTNLSSGPVTDITISDDKLTVPGSIASLAPGASETLTASAFLEATLTNTATASGFLSGSACDSPADSVTVEAVIPACDVEIYVYDISDDSLKLKLTNNDSRNRIVTLEEMMITYPRYRSAIREVKLDGTIYKRDDSDQTFRSPATIGEDDWTEDDVTKRQLEPGKTETLEVKTYRKTDKEDAVFEVTLKFTEGCEYTFEIDYSDKGTTVQFP